MKKRNRAAIGILACCALAYLAPFRAFAAASPDAAFSGARAFDDLKHLVSFGPRPSGSKALSDCRQWMIEQIQQTGLKVEEDSFTASTPAGDIPMTNLLVKIPGTSPKW